MASVQISVEQLTRDSSVIAQRQKFTGGNFEKTDERKAVSIMFLAQKDAAREMLLDINPTLDKEMTAFEQLMKKETKRFHEKRKRTMKRFNFF